MDTSHAPGAAETVHLSATFADGSSLPSWLKFDPASRTLSGTPPPGTSAVVVLVTAKDDQGREAQTIVHIKTGAVPGDAGKTDTNEQHGSLTLDNPGRAMANAASRPELDGTVLRNIFAERQYPKARPGLTAQIRSAHRANQLAYHAALFRAAEQMIHRS